ncbi:MAG: hypothetical protein AVDCRST_MAG13-2565 [uncultured Solirubrobacteraceae bacterium]|uniref:Uncharacterized protein n=1 Tax=uncultured Solirubrobacteraceae bacterium TaxID=1162706 RepID=A0A6J4SVV4_9ACTN|nr:MAG: hypothetical protein AVDCRST_MAG13-2565 [uncultured Solirubrobacteraceae bacterium]
MHGRLAQDPQPGFPQLALPRRPQRGGGRRPGEEEAGGLARGLRDAHGDLVEARAQGVHGGDGVLVAVQPQRRLDGHVLLPDAVVAQDAGGQALVRDDDPRVGGRAQPRGRQPHVLHDARLALERHVVADAQGLRDREDEPGDRVGDRLPGREADDGGGDRARGQDRVGQPAERRELREGGGDADEHDDRVDHPAQEAQPRVRDGGELPAGHAGGDRAAVGEQRAVHEPRDRERQHEAQGGLDLAVVAPEGRLRDDVGHEGGR